MPLEAMLQGSLAGGAAGAGGWEHDVMPWSKASDAGKGGCKDQAASGCCRPWLRVS